MLEHLTTRGKTYLLVLLAYQFRRTAYKRGQLASNTVAHSTRRKYAPCKHFPARLAGLAQH